MASEKTAVIEYLFDSLWDPVALRLIRSVVMQTDVVQAIEHVNGNDGGGRSARNPANFLKDIIRSRNASSHWPEKLKQLKYTAVQRMGGGRVFEFVPYEPDQTEPFPDTYVVSPEMQVFPIQSLSMLSESKGLGRRDEAWLIQTAVNLRVIESHFALTSPIEVEDVIHLQMSVKLRQTEIDAMFLAKRKALLGATDAIAVTCEAKRAGERILEGQIVEQVKAAFEETDLNFVVPLALRSVSGRGIHVIEFELVERSAIGGYVRPTVAEQAVYEFRPAVPGI